MLQRISTKWMMNRLLGPPIIDSYGGISLHEQSHGESFLALAQNSFRANGLYLLDEPEAALSPQRQLSLMAEIRRCTDAGAQFVIATHSPFILGIKGARIYDLDTFGAPARKWTELENVREYFRLFHDRRDEFVMQSGGETASVPD